MAFYTGDPRNHVIEIVEFCQQMWSQSIDVRVILSYVEGNHYLNERYMS